MSTAGLAILRVLAFLRFQIGILYRSPASPNLLANLTVNFFLLPFRMFGLAVLDRRDDILKFVFSNLRLGAVSMPTGDECGYNLPQDFPDGKPRNPLHSTLQFFEVF